MYQRYMTNTNQQPGKQGKPPTGEMGNFRQNRQNPQNPTQPAHSPKPQPRAAAQNQQNPGMGNGSGIFDRSGISGRTGRGAAPRPGQHSRPLPPMQPIPNEPVHKKQPFSGRDTILGLLPPSLYNPQTKKILGFLSAEDLLLAALIFLMLDSGREEDSIMVYVLLYLLLSDYIDLPL